MQLDRVDGVPGLINPAMTHLFHKLGLERVEDILPVNHTGLVKATLTTNTALKDERDVAGRTIAWSYHPVNDSGVIYIYGHDTSEYKHRDR